MKLTRTGSIRPLRLLRAAAFALVSVGSLAAGLGLTTYTVSKANELVFGPAPTIQSAASPERCALE